MGHFWDRESKCGKGKADSASFLDDSDHRYCSAAFGCGDGLESMAFLRNLR